MTNREAFTVAHALTRKTLECAPRGTSYRATFGAALRIVRSLNGWGTIRASLQTVLVVAASRAALVEHVNSSRRAAGARATVEALCEGLYEIRTASRSDRALRIYSLTDDNRPEVPQPVAAARGRNRRVFPCSSLPAIGDDVLGLGTVTGYGRVWRADGHTVDAHGLDPWVEGALVRYVYAN